MSSENTFFIEVEEVLKETDKAILVKVAESETIVLQQLEQASETGLDFDEVWIPKSQIHEDSEVNEMGDVGNLVITRWLAEQKGLW